MDRQVEENAGAGGWASSDSPVGQLSAQAEVGCTMSDTPKDTPSVVDVWKKFHSSTSLDETPDKRMAESGVSSKKADTSEISEANVVCDTVLLNEPRAAQKAQFLESRIAETIEQLQSRKRELREPPLRAISEGSNAERSLERKPPTAFSVPRRRQELCMSNLAIPPTAGKLSIALTDPIEKQVKQSVNYNPGLRQRGQQREDGSINKGQIEEVWRTSPPGKTYSASTRECEDPRVISVSKLKEDLARCRQELAQEKATCESLRYYYGCGASEMMETESSKELKQEVVSLRTHNEKLLMEMRDLRKNLGEEKQRSPKSIATEGKSKSGDGGCWPEGKERESRKGISGWESAAQRSVVELLQVQVGALKAIVSIQEGEVLRKSQVGSVESEHKQGGSEEKSLQDGSQLIGSEAADKQGIKKGESDRHEGRCEGERDNGLRDADYVKQVLSRWREEVYALVLECKQREWEAVKESEMQRKQFDRERALREELDSKCKVLEQKAISLRAELQLQKDAAQRSQEALSRLEKEHATVTAARDQAQTSLQFFARSVQDSHQQEEEQLLKLAESEKDLRGFVKRLTFAESRLAVVRQLGRTRRVASRDEGEQINGGENGMRERRGPREAQRQNSVDASRRGLEDRKQSGQNKFSSRDLSGRESSKHAKEEQSELGYVAPLESKEAWGGKGPLGVTRNGLKSCSGQELLPRSLRSCSEREMIDHSEKRVSSNFAGAEKEVEAEVMRLQEERAMLVERMKQLEGGVVLASLTSKLAKLEASLADSVERAEAAESRAANLEDLLASARASLAVEGEAVKQLQAQLHDLEVSSKKALSRQLRQAEEQSRADLAAASEAHEKVTSALQSRVSALERENAKVLVNLRQLERQAAHSRERKQTERDARVSELESRLQQRESDLKGVRKERSVLLAQLRKLEKEAHVQLERERKLCCKEGGLHAEIVVTPAPSKESNGRQPLIDASSVLRNGVALGAREEERQEIQEKLSTTKSATVHTLGSVQRLHFEQTWKTEGANMVSSGTAKDPMKLMLSPGMRPLESSNSSLVALSPLRGGSDSSDSEYALGPGLFQGVDISAIQESSQQRRVSEVMVEGNDDLLIRLNKLAQLSHAILEDPTLM